MSAAPSRNKLQAAPFVSPAEAESRLRAENARLRAAVADWHDEAAELRAALEDAYTFIDSEYRNPNPLLGEYISAEAKEVWETICAALARPATPDRRSWLVDVREQA